MLTFILLLACIGGIGPASAWQSPALPIRQLARHAIAVFGSDDRGPLPAKLKSVQEKMGVLFNLRARTVCTAFCVAKDTIATAGHCLYRTAGERPPQLPDFWFARNYDAVRDYALIAGHGRGAAQHVVSAARAQRAR
jgi:protease YdgD